MNETSQNSFPTSASNSANGLNGEGAVHRVAQKAHEAVDKLEQTLGTGSEKVMSLQQEYGEMAREQVKANPLIAVGAAFAVGIVFSKLFMR
jgi:ElaB/YqjD/DUF883 family membrane-anchored ribosome-binding protein